MRWRSDLLSFSREACVGTETRCNVLLQRRSVGAILGEVVALRGQCSLCGGVSRRKRKVQLHVFLSQVSALD